MESEEDDEPQSGELFKDYIIAEITQHLENGTDIVHVIAESIHYANSCYVLRGDMLAEMSIMCGKELNWRDIFKERKNTARQMGARDFRHRKNTDLPGRVIKYLSTDIPELLRSVALKWTEGTRSIYDAHMSPTKWNRLPSSTRGHIASNPITAKAIVENWKGTLLDTATPVEIGRIAGVGTEADTSSNVESDYQTLATVSQENATLKEELKDLKARLAEAEKKLAILRDVLGK